MICYTNHVSFFFWQNPATSLTDWRCQISRLFVPAGWFGVTDFTKREDKKIYLHFVITVLYKEKITIYFLSVQRIPASSRLQILNFNQQHCNFTKGKWFVDFRNFGKFSCGIIVSFIVFLNVFVWFCSFDPAPLLLKKCWKNIQIQLPH